MKDVFLFILILSIYKSYDWIFHGMAVEIVFNKKIQIVFFSNQFIFLWGKMCVCVYIIEKTLSLNFNIFIRKKNMNKISNIKNDVLCNVWMK
jgi:hypothetical protein